MNACDRMTTGDDFQPKLIYLTKRHPALSRSGFTARWRQHGALGMSLPRWRNIARYVHCDVVSPDEPTPALDGSYDGIGLIWHRSQAARAAHLADTGSRHAMEQDERETFAEPIVNVCLLARESVLLAPDATDVPLTKLTCFFKAHDAAAAAGFPADRIGGAVSLRAQLAEAGSVSRGHVVNAPLAPRAAGRWGLDVDGVEEWWFADQAAALRAAAILRSSAQRSAARVVLTNEVLLYSAGSKHAAQG